ncbi:MAG: NAD(P)-dependent oxidoreductase [Chloroflexota bacterium]|nr:MAG: NAD(P)-dependent oxidoreductase [Chloroflexota bacterium]
MATLVVGLGYVGATLAGRLLGRGERVIGLDNFFSVDRRTTSLLERHGAFELIEGDIRSESDVVRAFSVEAVDHLYFCAAQASADDSTIPASYTETTNLIGPRIVFEEAARRDVGRIVLASAMRVYGQPLPSRVDESTPFTFQRDLTHLSKLYLEGLAHIIAERSKMPVVSVRLGVVYGVGAVVKTDPRFMTVANRLCWQACHGEAPRLALGVGHLPIVHVSDAVAGMIRAAQIDEPGYSAVNLAGDPVTLRDLAEVVASEASRRGRTFDVPAVGGWKGDAPVVESRLTAMGFAPRVALRDGLRELIDYFLARV